ncbi:MAG: diphosphomevalonate decarboxylase [Candidatus Thermofonsia Clade 1 bacterium]|uniref:diphosphomevalonate decarboxylase n=1 Tax=Candidatus Thermofonsia Clade 1 bacterium TaxID=2364210 RepID=A0A2M8PDA0_9CHLR|nr:MAG: diphosphomevalonate decarboxylase [Candidatus Thermofonsia Clade 1 bacterium]
MVFPTVASIVRRLHSSVPEGLSAVQATACAYSNIAFIKYWGNRDHALRLPANPSLSMNLEGLFTRTTVRFSADLSADRAQVDGHALQGASLARVTAHLDYARRLAGCTLRAEVISQNNFPAGAGIASSASAFAALSLAAATALGLRLSEAELSAYARLGSGSAARSVPNGFVVWHMGEDHASSYAESIAPAEHWPLNDLVAIISTAHKAVGSSEGHRLAESSPFQPVRVATAPTRLAECVQAVLSRDFERLARLVELDSDMMHAVMQTSTPPLLYWLPPTVAVMQRVRQLRAEGVGVCYSIDAGANVHCLCLPSAVERVRAELSAIDGVQAIREARAGGAAWLESVSN